MRKTLVLALVVMLAVGVVLAKSFVTGYEPDGLDELKKQKGSFKTTLVRPDADFSRSTEIQVKTVALVISDPGASADFSTGRLIGKPPKQSVVPEFDEVVEFKRIVGDVLSTELAQGTELQRVERAGPETLVLQPVVTEVMISSSSKNTSEDGRELPKLDEGTVVFDLIDGETGKILLRVGEKRRCKPPKGAEKSSGAWPNLAYWTEGAATDLCQVLEELAG